MSPHPAGQAPDSLPRAVLAAYGLAALPLGSLSLIVVLVLPAFYAASVGIAEWLVGVVIMGARLVDVVTDPLTGHLSDRLGRRRPFVLAGVPLLMLAVWFLFLPAADADWLYLLGWSLVMAVGTTLTMLPLSAWGAELSADYHERSRIAGYRQAFFLAGLIGALLLFQLASGQAGTMAPDGIALVGWVLLALLPVGFGALVLWVPERRRTLAAAPPAVDWRDSALILWRNQPYRRLMAVNMANGIASGLPPMLFLFYCLHVLQAGPGQIGLLLVAYFVSAIAGAPLWLTLSRRWGKHRSWTAAMVWAAAGFPAAMLLGPGDFWWFLAVCVATGLAFGADLVFPPAIQADVVDLDTVASGRQRAGLMFALQQMVGKLAIALAYGIGYPLLWVIGFDAAADPARAGGAGGNAPATLTALALMYALLPVLFKLAAIALLWRFPIDADRQAALRRTLDAAAPDGDHDADRIPHPPAAAGDRRHCRDIPSPAGM